MISDTCRRADGRLRPLNQVLHDDQPDDVVEVVREHGQPRVLLLLNQPPQVVDRRVRSNRDDVRPRRHDLAHQRLAEVDDRPQQPAFVSALRRTRASRWPSIRRPCGRTSQSAALGRRAMPMMSAVSGLMRLATTVNTGSSSSRICSGIAPHDRAPAGSARRPTATPNMLSEQREAADPARDRRAARSKNDRHDQQDAAHQARRHEELERIVEVGAERVAVALALGLEPLRQAHQQRERRLDERQKNRPARRPAPGRR